jgi:O-methyltransferase
MLLKIKRVVAGIFIKLLSLEIFIIRNKNKCANYRVIDVNQSLSFATTLNSDLALYNKALDLSDMRWTDNFYKQLRVLSFIQLVRYAARNNPSGIFLELGVWRGLSAVMIAEILRGELGLQSKIVLFDSFEGGLSDKSANDTNFVSEQSVEQILKEKHQFTSTQEQVESALSGYPNIEIHAGWVPEVLYSWVSNECISFVHLDMDLYDPTVAALEHLWPKLASRGVIVLDDYNSSQFPGVTIAVKEFLEKREGEVDVFYEVPFGACWMIKA